MEPEAEEPKVKPDQKKKEAEVRENLHVVANWSAVSVRIFELEEKLRKARAVKENLEKAHPKLLSQIKGLVRKDQSAKGPRKEEEEEMEEEPKNLPDAAALKKRKHEERLLKTPKSAKRSLDLKMKEVVDKNKVTRNADFDPTFRGVEKRNPNDS